MRRVLSYATWVVVLALGVYFFREPLHTIEQQLVARVQPCVSPIGYSIQRIDPRFGVSTSTLLKAIAGAEGIWETPSSRDLFSYDQSGGALSINLIYDERQATTLQLKSIDKQLSNTQETYDSLRVQYDSERAAYVTKKAQFDADLARYEAHQAAYNRDVEYWNARGGAPEREYQKLQAQKQALASESAKLGEEQHIVNSYVDNINGLADALNKVARALNLNIAAYNTIGSSTGTEFEEAVYESSVGDEHINVYEFATQQKLVRVLAHEMGHALGLEHVDDQSAIMYRVNQSTNSIATQADLAELDRICRSK